jgi:transcriptional regulator with XRE-family HTH domain
MLNAVRLNSHHTGATAHCGAAMDDQVYRRIGENIAKWRQRRGISQNVLGGLIGRSESWVSQVERGALKVDRLSVLVAVARELGVQVADLVDELPIVRAGNGPSFEGLQSLRSALQLPDSLRIDAEPERNPVKLRREMDDSWHLFHACRYGTLAAILPLLRSRIGANSQILAEYYQLTSGMIKKLGDAHLARLLAERSINHAADIRDDGLAAAGAWRLSFACQSLGLHDEAVSVAMAAESSLTDNVEHLAMRGALHLNAAIACGLKEDRVAAREHLTEARAIGPRVRDGNAHQTFFGPTNVRITEVSVAVELHDGVDPLAVSTRPPLIESAERRARHLIDLAYGHAQLGKDEAATERLLEADQIAHEEVRLNPRVRTFVGQLLDRERPSFRTKVRTLAQRAGVNRAS